MWFEELGITKVLFNTQESNLTFQFTQGTWFKEPGMTNVLFDIWNNNNMKLNR